MKTKIFLLSVFVLASITASFAQDDIFRNTKYDDKGNPVSVEVYKKHSDNSLTPLKMTYYAYDQDEKCTEKIVHRWDFFGKKWSEESKSEYKYNDMGKVCLLTSSDWDTGRKEWKETSVTVYEYNGSGELTSTENKVIKGNTKKYFSQK